MGFSVKHHERAPLEELLEAARSEGPDDTLAMGEILRRFEGLAIRTGQSIRAPQHLRDDLINAARTGLVSAVRHHDGRAGFPAFAKKYMRGAALRELDRWIVPETTAVEGLDELGSARGRPSELEEVDDRLAPWGAGAIASVIEQMDSDQMKIVDLRYRRDLPVKAIATIVGTSAPAVSQRLATIHRIGKRALAA